MQASFYNGHKKSHCIGLQAITGPDGMIYDVHTVEVGRRNDAHFMTRSNVNNVLATSQLGHTRQYKVYLDKGYATLSHCIAATRMNPTPQQTRDSAYMSTVRISVEHVFSKLKTRNVILDRRKLLKVAGNDVWRLARVCALMTNVHSCLHGNQIALDFNCGTPLLEEYFA